MCINTNGTFYCQCLEGYELQNETVCVGKHHCLSMLPLNLTVHVRRTSFKLDIDECNEGTNLCDINAKCINTNGSYECICNSGYEGSGLTCRSTLCGNYKKN